MNREDCDLVAKVVADAVRNSSSELLRKLHDMELELATLRASVKVKAKQGEAGPAGERGLDGERGLSGPEGKRGERGLPGKDGLPGSQGPPGERGETGLAGARGERGLPGTKGEKGDVGDPGVNGEKGERGPQGIKGDRGEPGLPGDRGEKGERGERGEPGLSGDRGEKGDRGERGAVGPAGDRGERGVDGRDGRDGTDALSIDILPDFDPDKTYLKGTYASRHGGLWRCNGHDWTCIVDGIRDVDVMMQDDRTIILKYVMASGRERQSEFHVPALVYREIWKDGETYLAGDVVTLDGSMWVALQNTQTKPGQFAKHWRLSVKRGKNGKSP